MALSWPTKDPNDFLDYCVDWTNRLIDSDTISTVEWIVPDGLTASDESNDTTKAIIWLAGGTAGTTYQVTCRVTTTAGRIMDQTINLKCAEK